MAISKLAALTQLPPLPLHALLVEFLKVVLCIARPAVCLDARPDPWLGTECCQWFDHLAPSAALLDGCGADKWACVLLLEAETQDLQRPAKPSGPWRQR